MCDECARLQAVYKETTEQLVAAQRELARFGVGNEGDAFTRLWKECDTKLRAIWNLREEIAGHAATHSAGSMSAQV